MASGILAAFVVVFAYGSSTRDSNAAWEKHRALIRALPDELYRLDRFRSVRGRVTDESGKPVSGALVRCARVEKLVELVKGSAPSVADWKVPIETQCLTSEDGTYEFAHLPVGARTFFYSAAGRELAPAIKDLIVVQDGLGAQLNVTLLPSTVLRLRLGWSAIKPVSRFHLIPYRWWPEIVTQSVPRDVTSVEFRGLGGPFRKGLIAVSDAKESSPLRVVGRYDLDRWTNISLVRPGEPASRFDLAESAQLEPMHGALTSSMRQFYAAMSPFALFWALSDDFGPLRLPFADFFPLFPKRAVPGMVRGFAPNPFMPVLIDSPLAANVLTWTTEASEFEVGGLASGVYRARGLDLFGRVTFASGSYLGPGHNTSEPIRLWSKVDLDEPESREVMGFVRWESGAPAAKAVVLMQNAYNFRKYARRVETDEHGFYRFSGVQGNEPYFVFALPPGEAGAMRNFEYFGVAAFQREVSDFCSVMAGMTNASCTVIGTGSSGNCSCKDPTVGATQCSVQVAKGQKQPPWNSQLCKS